MKVKSIKHYTEELWLDIEEIHGERPRRLRHMIEKTARDQRHLAEIDSQLEGQDFTTDMSGSMGQMKTEINPLLAHRDKVSRTVTDDLEALQLTARSIYKKQEGKAENEDDKLLDYLKQVK